FPTTDSEGPGAHIQEFARCRCTVQRRVQGGELINKRPKKETNMELRTYQNEQQLFEDFQRYSDGDMRAGRRVSAEIAATGVKLSEIAHAATQYANESPLTRSTEATEVEVKMAGDYLHADTMKIL